MCWWSWRSVSCFVLCGCAGGSGALFLVLSCAVVLVVVAPCFLFCRVAAVLVVVAPCFFFNLVVLVLVVVAHFFVFCLVRLSWLALPPAVFFVFCRLRGGRWSLVLSLFLFVWRGW